MNQTLDKIRRLLDKWSAGFEGGVLVLSPEGKRRRDGEFRAWVDEERAAEQAAVTQAAGDPRMGLVSRLIQAAGHLRHRG